VTGDQVAQLPSVTAAVAALAAAETPVSGDYVAGVCAQQALAASDVLYALSGRQFTGVCGPVTIRPLARPTDADSRAWAGGFGYYSNWGYAASYGATPGVAQHYLSLNPPEIDLGAYPVTDIVQVLIDGVLIPAEEYELRDYRTLVRIRPTAEYTPTERWGWPSGQIQDLPDDQPGTFSVTYLYGQPPPAGGQSAALKLAAVLALPLLGDTSYYPERVTQVTRQGVSAKTVDSQDMIAAGMTGIYEVDLWVMSVNPHKLQRQARVFSPDMGRPRRQATPSVSGGT
jgi:hypothetical protein